MKYTEKESNKLKVTVMQLAVDEVSEYYGKIRLRCLLEGCRYGYYKEDDIQDTCLYCGEQNPYKDIPNDFYGMPEIDNVMKKMRKERAKNRKIIEIKR